MFESLSNIVISKFSDSDQCVKIKILPGIKLFSKYIPIEKTSAKNISNYIPSKYSMSLGVKFSDNFRNEIRELHKIQENSNS